MRSAISGIAISTLSLAGCAAVMKGIHGNAVWGAPEACEIVDHHIGASVPTDLGNGFVVRETSAVMFSLGGSANSGLDIYSCSAAKEIYVGGSFSPGLESDGLAYDRRDQLAKFQTALLDGTNLTSLDQVSALAKTFDLKPSEIRMDRGESCGCAALYPDMLGEQEPYYGREL